MILQWRLFLTALRTFTRIPLPRIAETDVQIDAAARYMPMVRGHTASRALVVSVIATRMTFTAYVKHELGACTGDCLGATQQLTEVGFYLGALAAWTYI